MQIVIGITESSVQPSPPHFSNIFTDTRKDLAKCDVTEMPVWEMQFFLADMFNDDKYNECCTIDEVLRMLRRGHVDTFNVYYLKCLISRFHRSDAILKSIRMRWTGTDVLNRVCWTGTDGPSHTALLLWWWSVWNILALKSSTRHLPTCSSKEETLWEHILWVVPHICSDRLTSVWLGVRQLSSVRPNGHLGILPSTMSGPCESSRHQLCNVLWWGTPH